ncbi:hypothetical protein WK05_24960 [Burkholderia ubonensis]|nr:hypothetical protein WJ72_09785 [Burkholderia ubonensis]KVQ62428.1 hypothetical protein WK05_24960 [Burkholderia ubonensis]
MCADPASARRRGAARYTDASGDACVGLGLGLGPRRPARRALPVPRTPVSGLRVRRPIMTTRDIR